MVRDFTVEMYVGLIQALKVGGYSFQTFKDFVVQPKAGVVLLRHDVDKMPYNSLRFAILEKELGVQSSFFFRIANDSFNPSVIKQIAALEHEIGYHYEDMDLCHGDIDQAHVSFQKNLARLRELYPVKTVCMHGSPMSKFDNRVIWGKYNYRNDGIIGEPYFDVDYSKVFYVTDTGRKWNHSETSIRDKVDSGFDIHVNNTFHLIKLIEVGKLPDQLMINTHPQRWNDGLGMWVKELVWQGIKNQIKRFIAK